MRRAIPIIGTRGAVPEEGSGDSSIALPNSNYMGNVLETMTQPSASDVLDTTSPDSEIGFEVTP